MNPKAILAWLLFLAPGLLFLSTAALITLSGGRALSCSVLLMSYLGLGFLSAWFYEITTDSGPPAGMAIVALWLPLLPMTVYLLGRMAWRAAGRTTRRLRARWRLRRDIEDMRRQFRRTR